jgi:cephalosporin hydroxylase
MEAIAEFLRRSEEFSVDRGREKFFLTFNPNGFLRRQTEHSGGAGPDA